MKKIISLILAICFVIVVAACGKTKKEEELPTEAETNTEVVFEEETEEETTLDETAEEEKDSEETEKNESVNKEEVKEEVKEEIKEESKEEVKEEATEEAAGEKTLGNTLLSFFNEKAKENLSAEEIANAIASLETLTFAPATAPVEEGFLAGFDEEIHGFTKGFTFAPMIGSIPFVGYVFETDDADALIASLKENANLRWNICVEAEEMVVGKNGNKVFFVMCPKNMEE